MKLKQSILAAAMLVVAAVPMQAQAVTSTATIAVSAVIVQPVVTIAVAGPLNFGTMVSGVNASATTSFDVTMTNGVSYGIALGNGLHSPNTTFMMLNTAGTSGAGYNLYSDSTKATAYLGSTINQQVISNKVGTGAAQTYSLYAEGQVNQSQLSANISDTITITVFY